MADNLLIVESPAKAKTIEKILGNNFIVKSCYGHIRDLAKEGMGIDIEHGFEPNYEVPGEKQKVVKDLRQHARNARSVWLASDEDREGESISWHLAKVLNLPIDTTKRIVFSEITKPAITKAINNPRTINMNLVNSQQARRVLDRLVGFELSPVLWRKIGTKSGLSAGRVQSVAVKLIVEREREINAFEVKSHFKIEATLAADENGKQIRFKAEDGTEKSLEDATKFLEACRNATYHVKDVTVKPGKRTSAAPFTTSTLQQEASRKLGYGVGRTMQLAQRLYENGQITYMRTDSVNLSETARKDIQAEILNKWGEKYLQLQRYKNKNESAQEAHEAIRPTNMSVNRLSDPDTARLYELIWKRTIASQMSDAVLEKTTAKIGISTISDELTATGEVIKFDGFLKVYFEGSDDEEEGSGSGESRLPALSVHQPLTFIEMRGLEKFSRHAPRYTEASLVKKLEELGIGRPSTYAPTISTIIKREYVEKKDKEGTPRDVREVFLTPDNRVFAKTRQEMTGAEKAKLFPTDLGIVVTDFLDKYFNRVMDYQFTANIEEEFDKIAEGKKQWNTVVEQFYAPFHENVAYTLEKAERARGERELGTDPESGKPVFSKMGRFGPMVQIGTSEDEEKPRFAKIKSSQSIETITLEEAPELFKLPLSLGEYEGQEVSTNVGRFGPYIKWGEQFISLPRGKDPFDVDLNEAIALIQAKQIEDAPICMYQNKPVTKGKGRFGPFIKWNDLFINIPRAYNFEKLTASDCAELIEKKLEKEANRYIRQWPEEKIALENGRWGPFIRVEKKSVKLPLKDNGEKYAPEELEVMTLDQVKALITKQDPGALKKTKSATGKPAAKKSAARSGTKKTTASGKTKTAKKAPTKKT